MGLAVPVAVGPSAWVAEVLGVEREDSAGLPEPAFCEGKEHSSSGRSHRGEDDQVGLDNHVVLTGRGVKGDKPPALGAGEDVLQSPATDQVLSVLD